MEKRKEPFIRYIGYNTYRLVTSFIMFVFVIICMITKPNLLFSFPKWVYILFTCYYAIFPIKDMISAFNKTNYKGKQFKKHYEPVKCYDEQEFEKMKKRYDKGALYSIIFWLSFLLIVGVLIGTGVLSKAWAIFFFAMSDFCVYFAIFFWCPFHSIFIKPHCCMDCRIFNWDSFFSFSFLIFVLSPYTIILVFLSLLSIIEWEYTYNKHPERFFRMSNENLSCEHCDMEHCRHWKEKNEEG